jgi:hypothetical protein
MSLYVSLFEEICNWNVGCYKIKGEVLQDGAISAIPLFPCGVSVKKR